MGRISDSKRQRIEERLRRHAREGECHTVAAYQRAARLKKWETTRDYLRRMRLPVDRSFARGPKLAHNRPPPLATSRSSPPEVAPLAPAVTSGGLPEGTDAPSAEFGELAKLAWAKAPEGSPDLLRRAYEWLRGSEPQELNHRPSLHGIHRNDSFLRRKERFEAVRAPVLRELETYYGDIDRRPLPRRIIGDPPPMSQLSGIYPEIRGTIFNLNDLLRRCYQHAGLSPPGFLPSEEEFAPDTALDRIPASGDAVIERAISQFKEELNWAEKSYEREGYLPSGFAAALLIPLVMASIDQVAMTARRNRVAVLIRQQLQATDNAAMLTWRFPKVLSETPQSPGLPPELSVLAERARRSGRTVESLLREYLERAEHPERVRERIWG